MIGVIYFFFIKKNLETWTDTEVQKRCHRYADLFRDAAAVNGNIRIFKLIKNRRAATFDRGRASAGPYNFAQFSVFPVQV